MKFVRKRGYKCTDLYDEAAKEDKSVDAMKRARRQLGESKELDIIVEDRRSSGGGYWWAVLSITPTINRPWDRTRSYEKQPCKHQRVVACTAARLVVFECLLIYI